MTKQEEENATSLTSYVFWLLRSTFAQFSAFSMSSYAASKHAVSAFTSSLRQEMRAFGVSVCHVEPGTMKTPMVHAVGTNQHRFYTQGSEELKAVYGEKYTQAVDVSIGLMRKCNLHYQCCMSIIVPSLSVLIVCLFRCSRS